MKKLFIDVPALTAADEAIDRIQCEYLFHRVNPGQLTLLEMAQFAAYCRQCEDAFCVAACPEEALERLETGSIKRYNMRCVGCRSCVLACPFGTIFPEVMNYVTAKCDYCLNQQRWDSGFRPACVETAPNESFRMVDLAEEDPEHQVFFVGKHLAVKSPSWRYKEERV